MTKMSARSMLLVAMSLALAATAGAQQEVPPPGPPTIQTQRPDAPPPGARPGQTPRAVAPGEIDRTAPQAFSVVLVLGDMQTATVQDNVPAAARKALADMKDFLPYKGYRLLDTQWTLCCGNAPLTGRLKGADEQEYELQLTAGGFSNGHANVRFILTEVGVSGETSSERTALLELQLEQLRSQRADLLRKVEVGVVVPANAQKYDRQIAMLERELEQARRPPLKLRTGHNSAVIDASFRMDIGETVVVGTSRTKGDKALIALLTAVPAKASTGRD